MIKTQIVKENNKPVAVIMDYREYVRLEGDRRREKGLLLCRQDQGYQ